MESDTKIKEHDPAVNDRRNNSAPNGLPDQPLSGDAVRAAVSSLYKSYVRRGAEGMTGSFAKSSGRSQEQMDALPKDAVQKSLSCGDPVTFSEIQPGQSILNLGCGAGIDLLVAAERVGQTGKVFGVDLSEELVLRARENTVKAGHMMVRVIQSPMEHLPVPDASVDWIISNCAINFSPEKEKVVAEMARALRPGGRILISDIVTESLPDWVRQLARNFITCIGLATSEKQYVRLLEENRFGDVKIVNRLKYDDTLLRHFLDNEHQDLKEQFEPEKLETIIEAVDGRIHKVDIFAEWRGDRDGHVVLANKVGG